MFDFGKGKYGITYTHDEVSHGLNPSNCLNDRSHEEGRERSDVTELLKDSCHHVLLDNSSRVLEQNLNNLNHLLERDTMPSRRNTKLAGAVHQRRGSRTSGDPKCGAAP